MNNYNQADVSLTLQHRLFLLCQVHLGLGEAGPVHHVLVVARQSGQPEDGVDGVSLDSGVSVLLGLVLDLHLQLAGQVYRSRADGSEAHHQLDETRVLINVIIKSSKFSHNKVCMLLTGYYSLGYTLLSEAPLNKDYRPQLFVVFESGAVLLLYTPD